MALSAYITTKYFAKILYPNRNFDPHKGKDRNIPQVSKDIYPLQPFFL